jgi:lysophospholipase L1-like esterase
MRFLPLALGCFLIRSSAIAQTIEIDPSHQLITAEMRTLDVHIGGRVKIEPLLFPPHAVSYVHQWPGVYFESAFKGDTVFLKFNDTANEYRLMVDDLQPIALAQPGNVDVRVNGLKKRVHKLRLEKVTESIDFIGAFEGFYISAKQTPLPLKPRKRQIEFIGDSDMTGYGIHSPTRTCTQEVVRLRSDTQIAYPALVSKYFNADYQVNAVAGRGMVRNYDGMIPEFTLPAIYPYVMLKKTAAYVDPTWKPDIMIIDLGANDFSASVKPGEIWRDRRGLEVDYYNKFNEFIKSLYQRHPRSALLIVWDGTINPANADAILLSRRAQAQVVENAKSVGFKTVEGLDKKDLGPENSACDFHSSISDHQKRAAWLIEYLAAHKSMWAPKAH